jgi:hypothetical protein
MRRAWRALLSPSSRPINIGVVAAVLLAAVAAGYVAGLVVWALWRFDLLQLSDHRHRA